MVCKVSLSFYISFLSHRGRHFVPLPGIRMPKKPRGNRVKVSLYSKEKQTLITSMVIDFRITCMMYVIKIRLVSKKIVNLSSWELIEECREKKRSRVSSSSDSEAFFLVATVDSKPISDLWASRRALKSLLLHY